MKQCPRCGSNLTEMQMGAVHIDGCHGCGGVWFDNAELGTIAQGQGEQLAALEDRFLPGKAAGERLTEMLCPICQVKLYEFAFEHSPHIKLDACSKCRGIWVDDGELQAIYSQMQKSRPAEARPATSAPAMELRQKGRQAAAFLSRMECPSCGRPNPCISFSCWACGSRLRGDCGLLCPNCDSPLTGGSFFDTHVDICRTCTGIWLDAGELSLLVHRRPEELKQLEEVRRQERVAASAMWDETPELLCPICSLPMQEREHTPGSGVIINACEQCHGVWVGAGKLVLLSQRYNKTLR